MLKLQLNKLVSKISLKRFKKFWIKKKMIFHLLMDLKIWKRGLKICVVIFKVILSSGVIK